MSDKKLEESLNWRVDFDEFIEKSECQLDGVKLALLVEKDLQVIALRGEGRKNDKTEVVHFIENVKRKFKRVGKGAKKCFSTQSFTGSRNSLGSCHDAHVFIPHIENNITSMAPLANELANCNSRVMVLAPEANDTIISKINKSFRPEVALSVTHALKDSPVYPDIARLGASFEKEIKEFFFERRGFEKKAVCDMAKTGRHSVEAILSREKYIRKIWASSRPRAIFLARPKRIKQLPFLLAAKRLSIPRFYVPHTLWFQGAEKLYRLYDLSLFSHAFAFSEKCADAMTSSNPEIKVITTGFLNSRSPQDFANKDCSPKGRVRVGYAAGKDGEIVNEMKAVIELPGVDFVIKTHPPGGNAKQLVHQVDTDVRELITIKDHNEVDLCSFMMDVDLLVAGRTNAGIEAAQVGVPVVGFYSRLERQKNALIRHAIQPPDVAIFQCSEIEELINVVRYFRDLPPEVKKRYCEKQRVKYFELFPRRIKEEICNDLVDSLKHSTSH